MLIKGRPLGICILAAWTAAHAIPGSAIALSTSGVKSALAWVLVAGQLALAAALIMRWRVAWYLVIAQVGTNVFVFAAFAWAFVFVAAAWGLHATDTPVVLLIAGYLLCLCAAFLYLFHPGVREYLASPDNLLAGLESGLKRTARTVLGA